MQEILRPGLIKVKDKCISYITDIRTVFTEDGHNLGEKLTEVQEIIKKSKIAKWESDPITFTTDKWIQHGEIYSYNLGQLPPGFEEYIVHAYLGLQPGDMARLTFSSKFRYLSCDIDNNNCIVYCNVRPSFNIVCSIYFIGMYKKYNMQNDLRTLDFELDLTKDMFVRKGYELYSMDDGCMYYYKTSCNVNHLEYQPFINIEPQEMVKIISAGSFTQVPAIYDNVLYILTDVPFDAKLNINLIGIKEIDRKEAEYYIY